MDKIKRFCGFRSTNGDASSITKNPLLLEEPKPKYRIENPLYPITVARGNLLKLMFIASFSVFHLLWTYMFLYTWEAFEKLSHETRNVTDEETAPFAHAIASQFRNLVVYKKNQYVTIAALCSSLICSICLTSNFTIQRMNKVAKGFVVVLDLVTLLFLSFLFAEAHLVSKKIHDNMPRAIASFEILGNPALVRHTFGCDQLATFTLEDCSSGVMWTFLPYIILEYLVILCLMTLAYIGLAYLIEWIIRHYFPPATNDDDAKSTCSRVNRSPVHTYAPLDEKALIRAI